uniref:NADH dehydrogenase subunit 2 n=1 Tax=Eviota epiphanes TaxID=1248218 RepID=UPI0028FCBFDB|nr:NADH dehydrogenase subunit 2 [Eviota epiphanes]WNH38212.1 NADH dehydrogenase subunit 2 [Eviota epiphanes]
MSPYVFALFLSTLGIGTTLTFASSHWLLAWVGLEVNTLAIIPLMTASHHPRATEAATKYFLTQATAAATLLFASATNAWLTGHWNISLAPHPAPALLVIIALSLKLGLAPFHVWLPEVLQGLTLPTGLVLSTWQKLAPLSLLLQLPLHNQPFLLLLGLLSALVGGWGGLNQTQLRKLLAYSSIAHLGWMILVIQFSPSLTIVALLVYISMTSAAFLTMSFMTATTINALALAPTKAPILAALFPLVLLSLGGLPPLTGFLPKWLILQQLAKEALPLAATCMALAALLSLYFYLRLCYALTLTTTTNNLAAVPVWRLAPTRSSTPIACMTATSLFLLPSSPAIFAMFAT